MNGRPLPFAAVLLAGGRSRRMGCDKALLILPDGRPLWQRQLAVLEALGPAELFISGPARDGLPAAIPRLDDETPGLGPLGGVAVALRAMHSTRLVVLAIDLPMMTPDFLRGLLLAHPDTPPVRGVVPQTAGGFFEPLAAVYPRAAFATAEDLLRGEDRSMQTFVRRLIGRNEMLIRKVATCEDTLFANWNRAGDVSF